MNAPLRDLDEFLTTDRPIELPIRGKTYRFPGSIPARIGLLLQSMGEKAERAIRDGRTSTSGIAREVLDETLLDDASELDIRRAIMGPAELEMAADGLTTAHTDHVFRTLITWHLAGEDAGRLAWETLGNAPTPNRAARRQAGTASGSRTRSQASTAGTTSTTRRAKTARRSGSSSSTGR